MSLLRLGFKVIVISFLGVFSLAVLLNCWTWVTSCNIVRQSMYVSLEMYLLRSVNSHVSGLEASPSAQLSL